jgi:hypothetical protein
MSILRSILISQLNPSFDLIVVLRTGIGKVFSRAVRVRCSPRSFLVKRFPNLFGYFDGNNKFFVGLERFSNSPCV